MNLLKNEESWRRWARRRDRWQGTKFEPPTSFPVFAYTVVLSYNYEEDQAAYLYPAEIKAMAAKMAKAQTSA